MDKLYFVTSNKNKVAEAQKILDIPLEIQEIEFDEIQSMDLEYVVRKKVNQVYQTLKKPVIVDDVGFYVDAWNGFPGPFIKFLDKAVGNKGILKMLGMEDNRKVTIKSAIGYHDGNSIHIFIGEIEGKISYEEKGAEGWGFDPIVIRDGEEQTIAELGFEHKNKVSHRSKSLGMFKKYLDSQSVRNKNI